jgi:large subunit ribosomal protein L29
MQTRELRALSDEGLLEEYEDQKANLYRLRQLKATGELVDTTRFKKTRKTIARILTILRERELAEQIALMEEDV